jgi:drug/metabolite transporter (DMT)-like permease
MLAILGGAGAALAWALSTLCSSRSSRLIDPVAVVAWVMVVGLAITGPLALARGIPEHVGAGSWGWLVLSGAGNVFGLALVYAAMRIGQVALVAPLASTEGAIAALIAILAGESIAVPVGVMLALIAVGVSLSAVPDERSASRAVHPRTVLLAMVAACSFGASLYATARAGSDLPEAWVVLSARLIGVLALALPLLISRRLRLTRAALPLVLVSGVCEVAGFFSYIAGARHGIAVAAVISSQFAALSAVVAYLIFHERLSRVQVLGVSVVIVGVAVLSGLRA